MYPQSARALLLSSLSLTLPGLGRLLRPART